MSTHKFPEKTMLAVIDAHDKGMTRAGIRDVFFTADTPLTTVSTRIHRFKRWKEKRGHEFKQPAKNTRRPKYDVAKAILSGESRW